MLSNSNFTEKLNATTSTAISDQVYTLTEFIALSGILRICEISYASIIVAGLIFNMLVIKQRCKEAALKRVNERDVLAENVAWCNILNCLSAFPLLPSIYHRRALYPGYHLCEMTQYLAIATLTINSAFTTLSAKFSFASMEARLPFTIERTRKLCRWIWIVVAIGEIYNIFVIERRQLQDSRKIMSFCMENWSAWPVGSRLAFDWLNFIIQVFIPTAFVFYLSSKLIIQLLVAWILRIILLLIEDKDSSLKEIDCDILGGRIICAEYLKGLIERCKIKVTFCQVLLTTLQTLGLYLLARLPWNLSRIHITNSQRITEAMKLESILCDVLNYSDTCFGALISIYPQIKRTIQSLKSDRRRTGSET